MCLDTHIKQYSIFKEKTQDFAMIFPDHYAKKRRKYAAFSLFFLSGANQCRIFSVKGHKCLMIALLDDISFLQIENAVAILDGGKSMSDKDRGSVLRDSGDGVLDHLLGIGIDMGSCLIQHQNLRIMI